MKVRDILNQKGPEVITISSKKTIREAIQKLVNNNIGSLLVLDENAKLAGIITERDILRQSAIDPENYQNLPINNVMTKKLIIVEPEDDIEYVENTMTVNRIRHLPVVNNKVLVGIISIGDVVKYQLKEVKQENKYLMDYISGRVS